MQYDEKTGLYLDESKKDMEDDCIIDDAKEVESTFSTDKISPDDLIENTDSNPFNKKLLFICLGILLFVSLVYAFVKTSGLIPEKQKNQELQQASDITVPGYLANARMMESSENSSVNLSVPEESISVPQTSTVRTSTSSQTPRQSVSTNNVPVVTESDIASRKAPLLVQGANLSGGTTSSSYGTSSSSGYSSAYDYLSSYGSGLTESQYMQNSLSSLANLGLTGTSSSNNSSYAVQNMQSEKQSFYEQNRNNLTTGYYIGEDTIFQGTILHVVLDTAISTDMPGEIKAHFSENVYDSLTGQTLLIPAGTVVIARYNSSVSYSQSRIQIAWNTLIRPDGYTLDLGNINGVDSEGMAGVKGRVDEHLWEYAKAMGIISLFTAINGEFAYTAKSLGANSEYASNILSANQNAVNQLGNNLIERAMDIQPTIYKKSGESVRIFVNKNISLPPLEAPPVTQKHVRN